MLIISCPPWLAQITKKELQFLGFKSQVSWPATLYVPEHSESDIAKLNIWLRTANKVSLVVDSGLTRTFDDLFDLITRQPWHKIIAPQQVIVVEASSFQSQLSSVPAIQKIAKKAITKQLMQGTDAHRQEDHTRGTIWVSVALHQDKAIISLNSSGDSLHRRGYRTTTGDAPIKETIAAALIISSGWKFHEPLLDPCCGSGTIAIEAAMIAKNIAPWLQRKFAFEDRVWYPRQFLVDEKATAKGRQVHKEHQIYASDIDPEMIAKAKKNARTLWLDSAIQRTVRPCQSYGLEVIHGKQQTTSDKLQAGSSDDKDTSYQLWSVPLEAVSGTLLSNPPYGLRMQPDDLDSIHETLAQLIARRGWRGGFITGYSQAKTCIDDPRQRTSLALKNGSEDVVFWKKKEGNN